MCDGADRGLLDPREAICLNLSYMNTRREHALKMQPS